MRRIILVLVLLVARLHVGAQARGQERGRAAAARPLPGLVVEARGAAADRQRQDLDGAAGGRRMGALRPAGHHLLGQSGPPRTEQLGVKEREAPQRIQRLLGERRPSRAQRARRRAVVGRLHLLGHRERRRAARPLLPRPDATRSMSSAWSSAPRRPGAALIPRRLDERAPQVGDLICASRDGSGTTLDNLNRGAGHCDHRGRGAARRRGRHRRQCGQLGHPQRLSTGRQRVFVAHIRLDPIFTVIENRLP